MTSILQVKQLYKQFAGLQAVNGISFDVPEGICLGILGPNGAGKTTTMEILEGITPADSGTILYRNEARDERFKASSGIMFQATALQDFITVREALEMFRSLYPHAQQQDLQPIIEDCTLQAFLDQDCAKLSGGQRQRLLLATALVNDPDILFLDEPTTGLDPQARQHFWQLVHNIKQKNKTILLTTHYMDEAYELCDQIIIMDHGEIIASGTPNELLEKHFNDVVLMLPSSGALNHWLAQTDNHVAEHRQGVEIRTADINATLLQLQSAEVPLQGLQVRERNLEDLFLELTGKGLRQ